MLYQPISSPMMTRMLGFCAGACACAGLTSPGTAASKKPTVNAPSLGHVRCRTFILTSGLPKERLLSSENYPAGDEGCGVVPGILRSGALSSGAGAFHHDLDAPVLSPALRRVV